MKAALISFAAVAVVAFASPSAMAEEYQQGASGTCNGALPIFEQSLRFRPMALANTGSSSAFVSCTSENLHSNGNAVYGAYFHNTTDATVEISCTMVAGRDSFDKTSFPKTGVYPAGGKGFMIWNAATDNGNVAFSDLVNLSCNLPAGVELEYIANVTAAPK